MNNWLGEYVATNHEEGKGGVICVVASWLVSYIFFTEEWTLCLVVIGLF
jgi:hypothetical protein